MKKVLTCIDGSQYAESCCQYASWVAEFLGATLELVYVTDLRQFEVPFVADLSGSLGLQPYQSLMGELQGLEKKKADILLAQASSVVRDSGFGGEIIKTHKTGFLVDSLGDLEESSDLVVIGKRGENANFAADHLGSTMERVVRSSSKPCLVTSRKYKNVKKVLVAYQDVDSCHAAVDFLASTPAMKKLEIHLVSVATTDEEAVVLGELKAAEGKLLEAGIKPICQMLHGMTSQAIVEYSKEMEIDMLAMGAYGHSRIRHLIIGSTTTELLRECRLPALLFR